MMIAFCCSVTVALDRAKLAAQDTRQQRLGYQDDQYIKCTVADFPAVEASLLDELRKEGHVLQPAKCAVWVPALDDRDTEQLPVSVKRIWERYPRARGSMQALGGAAEGKHATSIHADGIGLDSAKKRADKCSKVIFGSFE